MGRAKRERRRALRAGAVEVVEVQPPAELHVTQIPEPVSIRASVAPVSEPDLDALTVPVLRDLAARRGIVLGKARTKAAILRALRA